MVFFYWDYVYIWMFPKIWVPQNGWFTMEILIKTDDLGVPLFLETPIYIYIIIIWVVATQIFFIFTPDPWGNDPI